MARKKKGRKKRTVPVYAALLAFSGFGALFLFSFFHLAGLNGVPSQPPFEECSSLSSPLSRQIGRIDQAIYRYLYKAKVPPRNILFVDVKLKQAGGAEWDFTELLIRAPAHRPEPSIEKGLERALFSLETPIHLQTEKKPHGETVVNVFSGAHYTHRIIIRPDARALSGLTNQEILPTIKGGRGDFDTDAPVPIRRKSPPRVAIIIDDLGYDRGLAESFMDLDLPLSLSVLPMAPFTREIVEAARGKGCELMLHLPMEPETRTHVDAGPGALLANMSAEEIRKHLGEHLAQVPGARGVNNHMGSRFTESEDRMSVVLSELKHRKLFYVDSRTTGKTVALDVALRLGVASAKRDVFLDNDVGDEAMIYQLQRLLGIARRSGTAVGIAHPHEASLSFLRKNAPMLKLEAKVVHVSEIVE
jgi:polysaccharide deacetylase 2 family uncharacterized protein YibQ